MTTLRLASTCLLPLLLALATTSAASAQGRFKPVEFKTGALPAVPPLGIGGGEVLLEVSVNEGGRVTAMKPLRTTDGFTQPMTDAVRGWQFAPAERQTDDPGAEPQRTFLASKIVVAGYFRAPVLLGPTLGEPIKALATGSVDAPKILTSEMPLMPPTAFNAGLVLAEVAIDATGRVTPKVVIAASPDFDSASLDALRRWKFEPARVSGRAVDSRAYVVFAFPVPVLIDPSGQTGRPPR